MTQDPTLPTDESRGPDSKKRMAESWAPNLIRKIKDFRIPILVVGHFAIFCLVYYAALVIRFATWFPSDAKYFWVGMSFVATTKLVVFYAMRNFHGWWRHVTFSDLLSLGRAATMSVLVIVLLDHFVFRSFQVPRTVVFIDWAFSIAVLAACRSWFRLWDEKLSGFTGKTKKTRALLIGENAECAHLAHLINSRPDVSFTIVGLVSVESKIKSYFSNLRVVGHVDEIETLCKQYRARNVFLPSGQLIGSVLRDLIDKSTANDIEIDIVPRIGSFLEGGKEIPIRPVEYNDLLRRPPVKLDTDAIEELIHGKVVLVTGAGGSIGSEICRQLIRFHPKRLVLLGRGENRIYEINGELSDLEFPTTLETCLANITDAGRIDEAFANFQPQVVFHAAAHKHVPLVEENVGEAIVNNVYGTQIVADAAHNHSVEKFVLVSTDKAVNPTSVMGCTKQLAERYCLSLDSNSTTRFIVTRFGNVLGSAGSVVPLFQKQIRQGGPITVTDPEMTRFFMTIPEAAQLVLQAAAMGKGGEIFVLEMGQQVKVVDLAKDLIRLAGLRPDSIEIQFTGIRPGEKLYEELYYGEEERLATDHEHILSAYSRPFDQKEVRSEIDRLLEISLGSPNAMRLKLKEIIPEFIVENNGLAYEADSGLSRQDQR